MVGGGGVIGLTNELLDATDAMSNKNMAGDLKQTVDIMNIASNRSFMAANSSMEEKEANSFAKVL